MTSLTPEQIAALTRKADQADVAKTNKSRWITPTDAEYLLSVVADGKAECVIGGEQFTISYDNPARTKFFIKPAKAGKFVPCGWYTTSLLKSIAA